MLCGHPYVLDLERLLDSVLTLTLEFVKVSQGLRTAPHRKFGESGRSTGLQRGTIMRNLNRGYLRITLAVGLAVGPLFTWFVANLPNPDFDGLTVMQRWGHADWCPAGSRGNGGRGRRCGNHLDYPMGGNRVGQMDPARVWGMANEQINSGSRYPARRYSVPVVRLTVPNG